MAKVSTNGRKVNKWNELLGNEEPDGIAGELDRLNAFAELFAGYSRNIVDDDGDVLRKIAYLNVKLVEDLGAGLVRVVTQNTVKQDLTVTTGADACAK